MMRVLGSCRDAPRPRTGMVSAIFLAARDFQLEERRVLSNPCVLNGRDWSRRGERKRRIRAEPRTMQLLPSDLRMPNDCALVCVKDFLPKSSNESRDNSRLVDPKMMP